MEENSPFRKCVMIILKVGGEAFFIPSARDFLDSPNADALCFLSPEKESGAVFSRETPRVD